MKFLWVNISYPQATPLVTNRVEKEMIFFVFFPVLFRFLGVIVMTNRVEKEMIFFWFYFGFIPVSGGACYDQ